MPKSEDHYHVTLADALSAHERALQKGGGKEGVSELSLIESAIARPHCGYYDSIEQKAAALVESVAGNHGFNDGNKRTSIILTHLFLAKSGYELRPHGAEELQDAMESVVLDSVVHEKDFADIVEWFKLRVHPCEKPDSS